MSREEKDLPATDQGSGMSAAPDEGDDLDPVAVGEGCGVAGASGDEFPVEFGGAGGGIEPEGAEEVTHAGPFGERGRLAVDDDVHARTVVQPGGRGVVEFGVREVSMNRKLVMVVAAMALGLTACRREKYSQESPDAVLKTARLMIENGDAEELHRLIWAETPEMRTVYKKLGTVLGSLQDLSVDVARVYPEDVEKLRKQAEEAAARGETSALLQRLAPSPMAGRSQARRPRPSQREQEEMFSRLSKQVFADPYGFIMRNEARLTTVYMTDDVAAIQFDGKPLLGLTMTEQKGRWYIVLPTNLPVIADVMPRNRNEYSIWASLLTAIDNTIIDVRADVNSGKAQSLDELGRLTGEKIVVPAGLCMLAYAKAVEERRKEREASRSTGG